MNFSVLLLFAAAAAAKECCWCDDSTPKEATSITGSDDAKYSLIFSDEFDSVGRKFANADGDTKWTALDIGDTSNQGKAFYLPDQATVEVDPDFGNTALLITTVNASHTGNSPTGEEGVFMPYKSAMLQSWNKFCFTGGVVEWRARQPRGAGYWPALWLFGNLGRAVYQNSNTGLWPWSYDQCDDDLKLPPYDPPQRISACDDRDFEKEGLHPFQGRGATELDVLEGAVTNNGVESYVVGSLQLSPGIPKYFKPPMFDFPLAGSGEGSWYTGLTFGTGGTPQTDGVPNNGWYGPPWGAECPTGCPDALSGGIVGIDDLDTNYWTYRMEWIPGPDGHISWIYNGAFVWGMSAASFGAYEVCTNRAGVKSCTRTPPRQIPEEPMSLVMNTAIGTWNGGASALDGKHWPALFWIDYVRVWQKETNVGCDPPNYPTKKYIDNNAEWYGEPVTPLGYETCPEVYPPSAYEHAKAIKDRVKTMRTQAVGVDAAGLPQAAPTSRPLSAASTVAAAPAPTAHVAAAAPTTRTAADFRPSVLNTMARQSASPHTAVESTPKQTLAATPAATPTATEAEGASSGLRVGAVALLAVATVTLIAYQVVVRRRSGISMSLRNGLIPTTDAEVEYETMSRYSSIS